MLTAGQARKLSDTNSSTALEDIMGKIASACQAGYTSIVVDSLPDSVEQTLITPSQDGSRYTVSRINALQNLGVNINW